MLDYQINFCPILISLTQMEFLYRLRNNKRNESIFNDSLAKVSSKFFFFQLTLIWMDVVIMKSLTKSFGIRHGWQEILNDFIDSWASNEHKNFQLLFLIKIVIWGSVSRFSNFILHPFSKLFNWIYFYLYFNKVKFWLK